MSVQITDTTKLRSRRVHETLNLSTKCGLPQVTVFAILLFNSGTAVPDRGCQIELSPTTWSITPHVTNDASRPRGRLKWTLTYGQGWQYLATCVRVMDGVRVEETS
ncbi:hypothetical protein J6590_093909 [Homalodisca vitripennis]|nr:hypothetical protein J6590_093909 [Homalodisca vitripennis]